MLTSELESVEIAFRSAQARLGLAAGLITRDEWLSLNPAKPSSGSYGMMMRLLRVILGLRPISRRLTQSYYRLARALETGYTLDPDGLDTSLNDLRDDFEDNLNKVATLDFDWDDMSAEEKYFADEASSLAGKDREQWKPTELEDSLNDWLDSVSGGDRKIKGEKHEWSDDRIQTLDDALEAFRRLIGEAGIKDLENKIKALKRKYGDDPDRLLAEITNEFLVNRDKLASVIDKAAIDSGRELIDDTIPKDRRVRQVARGTRGNPCYFCAMLASRGFAYTSKRAAVSGWHPNCHCYAIVRWSDSSELPQRNQYYERMWKQVTADYTGKDKVKAWRRWMTAQRKKSNL